MQEQEAIRQCQAGELEAQGILYKLHYQAVFRTAYGLTRNYDLAEDVTQEVFIELFTAIKRYDPRRPFAPWLHGIAAHKSLDRIRNSPKWKVVPIADADNIPSLNPSPEDFVVRSELAEAIWAEVGTLRPKQQAVVVLYYYKSFSVAEISQALGCPRATVRVRLHYARARLGDALRHLQEPPEEPGLTDPIPKNSQAPISPGLAEAKLARIGGQADQMACSYIPAEVEVETW